MNQDWVYLVKRISETPSTLIITMSSQNLPYSCGMGLFYLLNPRLVAEVRRPVKRRLFKSQNESQALIIMEGLSIYTHIYIYCPLVFGCTFSWNKAELKSIMWNHRQLCLSRVENNPSKCERAHLYINIIHGINNVHLWLPLNKRIKIHYDPI